MTIINVMVDDQRLEFSSMPIVASEGVKETYVKFALSSDWSGFGAVALFYRDDDEEAVYESVLDGAGLAEVPYEVTAAPGWIRFGLSGSDGTSVHTSEILKYKIVKGKYTSGQGSEPPAPGVYEQMLAIAGQMRDTLNAAVIDQNAIIHGLEVDMSALETEQDNYENVITGRINTLVANFAGSSRETVLYEGSDQTNIGSEIDLVSDPTVYDYLDIVLNDGLIGTIIGPTQNSYWRVTGETVKSTGASVTTYVIEGVLDAQSLCLRVSTACAIVDTGTASTRYDLVDGPLADESLRRYCLKVIGRKLTDDAEVLDIRVGADGTTYQTAGTAVRSQITALTDNLTKKLTTPLTSGGNADYGISGQILATDGTGKTEWVDKAGPSDEQVDTAVAAWLDNHPEATTTVQDGAITDVKLDSNLQAKQATMLTEYTELVNAFEQGEAHLAYNCGIIEIAEPITLSDRSVTNVKSFSDGVFVLNSTLFTWETPSSYHASPNFVNCTFIGNGNSLFVDNAYVLGGKFVNCKFINCSIVQNGRLVQSMRFINCYFENAVDTPLIHAKQVYETRFISCQAEAQNKAIIVDAYGTDENMITIHQLSFLDCIFEGQTNYIVRTHDGDVVINNCYTETNSMSFAKFLASNRANTPMLRVKISDCKINPTANVFFVDIDSSYEGAKWSFFTCYDSGISVGKLVNTNNLYLFAVERCSVTSGGKLLPSKELSKVYQLKNSIVDFTTPGHCIVKKFPCLITFDSYEGEYRTNLYFVSLSGSSNRPLVVCLSDPTKTPTAAYDSETGYVDVTLHSARQNYQNTSAVLLNGLTNNLIRNDYWDIVYSGYSV